MHTSAVLLEHLLSDLPNFLGSVVNSDTSLKEARQIWLVNSLVKKWEDDPDVSADSLALDKFVTCNNTCREFALRPTHLYHDHVIGEVKSFFDNVFHEAGPGFDLTASRIFEGFGLGPGANVNVKHYDFYTKLWNSPLSRTNDQLYREYRYAIVENPHWISAELKRKAQCGDAIVAGSRLSFVPKTSLISRTICTEPTLNMLFQKSIGSFLESRLRGRFGIDLSYQPELNRRLARQGSIDGAFGTIDLVSASDSISIELCRQLLPREAFSWLMRARSPVTVLPNGTQVNLDMISSMGNAFTFPLQTMIFASLVTSCYRILGIQTTRDRHGPTNWAVFGDDIIVRKDAYEFVVSCLQLFGFQVNVDKSFNSGCFRESCGGDYFKGHDIRGVYIKTLKHEAHVFSALNRLMRWSAISGVLLPNTFAFLSKRCRIHMTVPPGEADISGFKVPLRSANRSHGKFGAHKYRALIPKVTKFKIPADESSATRMPGFQYNGSGLFLALLSGNIVDGRVGSRSRVFKASVGWRSTHNWDAVPAPGVSRDRDWEITIDLHLAMLDLG